MNNIKQQQAQQPTDNVIVSIEAEIGVLATDDIKYLFKDDKVKYKRDFNPALLTVPKSMNFIHMYRLETLFKESLLLLVLLLLLFCWHGTSLW